MAEVLGAASAASGLLETSIRIVGRVRKANERQKELIRVLDNHDLELKNIKTIIQIVEDEDALQTAAVAAELVKLREIEKKLVECLKTLDPGGKGPIRKLAHQLVHGSKDEKTLADIMDELAHAKSDLSVRIQVANVGLTRTVEDTIVANAAAIDRIDQLLVPVFGEGRGLKIAQLLKDRSPQDDGMVPLSKADIAALNDEETSSTADSKAAAISERIIVGNSTQDQAFQINGAAGEDIWQDISRIEIRNNIATGSSFQINHATTFEVLKYTMERQDRILAEERKEKREAQERREERVRLEKERRKKREVQDRKEKEKLMLTG